MDPKTESAYICVRRALYSCPFAVVFLRVVCVSVVKLSGYERLGYTVSGREACFCG